MNQKTRVENALTALVLDEPFFAVLAMRLQLQESKDIPTFATDGKSLIINPEFCSSLKQKEIVTILAHEVLHCAMGHVWRSPTGVNHETWNRAIDNEANWELQKLNDNYKYSNKPEPFPFPDCGKEMQNRFKDMSAELVYQTLMSEKMEEEQSGKGKSKEGKEKSKQGFGDVIVSSQNSKKEELKEQWERAVVQAVNASKKASKVPGTFSDMAEKIVSTKVNWRDMLKDYLMEIAHEDYSFSKPNNRYSDTEFILPSLYSEKMGDLVFAIDTSGSIDLQLASMFIAEAQWALDSLKVNSLTILCCDTEIHHEKQYQPGDIIDLKLYGRGGTDFKPVFNWCDVQDNIPKVLVYFTDLWGDFPKQEPEYPVLWMTKTQDKRVPFGETIILE